MSAIDWSLAQLHEGDNHSLFISLKMLWQRAPGTQAGGWGPGRGRHSFFVLHRCFICRQFVISLKCSVSTNISWMKFPSKHAPHSHIIWKVCTAHTHNDERAKTQPPPTVWPLRSAGDDERKLHDQLTTRVCPELAGGRKASNECSNYFSTNTSTMLPTSLLFIFESNKHLPWSWHRSCFLNEIPL